MCSSDLGVSPGTYRWMRFEMCKRPSDTTPPNMKCTINGTEVAFVSTACSQTYALEPPITVERGDQLELDTGFSMAGTQVSGTGPSCVGSTCCRFPNITWSLTRNGEPVASGIGTFS